HDAGNVVTMVEACLDALQLNYDDDCIQKIVMNNHHHRILPLEQNLRHMQWEAGLGINGGAEEGYDDDYNLLSIPTDNDSSTQQRVTMELSHHLAHAYSTATQAPFDKGMVVVMDGMGESYRTMLQAKITSDPTYVSDLSFPSKAGELPFDCIPDDLAEVAQSTPFDWREAESVYVFEKKNRTIDIHPIFKRFTPENTPPTLYNHGFENMDSTGALYSRASSHIFGDWNACGKVMGLAPWMNHQWKGQDGEIMTPEKSNRPTMWGTLYSENDGKQFQQDKDVIAGMPLIARMDSDMFDTQGNVIAKRRYDFDDSDDNDAGTSSGEEGSRLPTRETTGEKNLCIAGGVGLNSVLNGKLSRDLGFERTFVSPYPGDDGIAIGCCAYGLFGNKILDKEAKEEETERPHIWRTPLPAYLGPDPSEKAIKAAIEDAAPWLEVEAVRDESLRIKMAAEEIELGGVIAWYHGRSEFGPRALGHRSILADPRKKGLVRFINQEVKNRESFRPFAPSVLAEHASEWFELVNDDVPDGTGDGNASPYMSLTAMVRKEKRSKIPAVTHVDGSSRLQTVTPEAEPLYHKLISKFFEMTGVPLVLNTSFNTLPGEPIVESPQDAIRTFLCSMGSIEMLVMGDYVIKRKKADLRLLLGETDRKVNELLLDPVCPKRAGPCTFETTFEADDDEIQRETVVTRTRVKMLDRPMHSDTCGSQEWFELLDELEGELLSVADGTATLNDILAQYTAVKKGEKGALSKEREEMTQSL
ncbi:MAG: hypothetical protein SGILL_008995, partial [Bacillariaceae sp.]